MFKKYKQCWKEKCPRSTAGKENLSVEKIKWFQMVPKGLSHIFPTHWFPKRATLPQPLGRGRKERTVTLGEVRGHVLLP